MKDRTSDRQAATLVLEYQLDAAPEKVWRAISIPAFRERWLPDGHLSDVAPVSTMPGEEVRYRVRDSEPPHLESVVAFQLKPNYLGGTTLRIVQDLDDARLAQQGPPAVNDNGRSRMRAA